MSRIKMSFARKALCAVIIFSVSLAVTVPGKADGGDTLYFGESEDTVAQNVQSTTVKRGEFYITGAVPGSIEYSGAQYVMGGISEGTVRYQQFLVGTGDTVKKGDPLVEVTVEVDEIEKEEVMLNLEAAERNLEDYVTDTRTLLDQYKEATTQGTEKDRRLAEISYDKLLKTFNSEVERRESIIDTYTMRLSEIEGIENTKYIKAPSDGIVGFTSRFRTGDVIGRWDFVCMLNDTSNIKVIVEGGSSLLRYNMPVKIVQTSGGNNVVELTGRVVTLKNTTVSVNLMATNDIIEVYGDASGLRPGDVSIRFDKVYVPDALLLPSTAIKTDTKGSYVQVYKDGIVSKRYIYVGGADGKQCWIVSGVEEGDIIILE